MSEIERIKKETYSTMCECAVAWYKNSGKSVQAPAIRKVIESVIRQKTEHVAILRPLDSLYAGPMAVLVLDGVSDVVDPEDILSKLVAHELAFSDSLDAFSASLSDEDSRIAVKAVADASRKFASWAQDHLDLLALF